MQDATPPAWWQTSRAMILLALLSAVPPCFATIPWLNDVPAHVARYHVQETIGQSPALARFFTFDWHFIPNLGVDLLVVPLGRLFGLLPAVTIATMLIPVLTVVGILWIAREAHGRITTTSLFALPLAYSYPLQFGFLNSCLSVAVALLAFASWLRHERHGRRVTQGVAVALFAPLLIVVHATGWGVFCVLVGGATAAKLAATRPAPFTWLKRSVVAALPLLWPVPILIAWRGNGDDAIGWWLRWDLDMMWVMSILRDRWLPLDILATVIVFGAALAPLWWALRFRYALALVVPAAILMLLGLTMPNKFLGSMFAAVRLIPVGVTVAILAVREVRSLPRWVGWFALSLFAARLISVSVSQVEAERAAETQLAALDHVPVGARIMALTLERCQKRWQLPRLWHLASVATIRRDAAVNDLFATPGQLLGIRDPAKSKWLAVPGQAAPDRSCPRSQWPVFDDVLAQVPWSEVEYLWVLNSDRDRVARRYPVVLIWTNGRTQLYRVNATGPQPRI